MFILYFLDEDDCGVFWNEYATYGCYESAYSDKLAGKGSLIVEV